MLFRCVPRARYYENETRKALHSLYQSIASLKTPGIQPKAKAVYRQGFDLYNSSLNSEADYIKLITSLKKAKAFIDEIVNPTDQNGDKLREYHDQLKADAKQTLGRPESKWKGFGAALTCLAGVALFLVGVLCPPFAPIAFFIGGGALFNLGISGLYKNFKHRKPTGLSASLNELCEKSEEELLQPRRG